MAQQDIKIARFDFGALRDFGTPFVAAPIVEEQAVEAAPVEEAPPPPPTYSQEDLDRAVAQAMEQGRRQGIEEGRQQAMGEDTARQQALQQAVTGIGAQMTHLQAAFGAHYQQRQQDVLQLSLAVARQVCSATLTQNPAALFETLVARCLPLLLRQPRIIATVHPDLATDIERSLQELRAHHGYEGAVEVRPLASLAMHDARLAWEDGSADIRQEDIWRAIETTLYGALAQPVPPFADNHPTS